MSEAGGGGIDILATAFNISVVVFICRKRSSDPSFRSCFFSLYLANSAAECFVSLMVNMIDWEGTHRTFS